MAPPAFIFSPSQCRMFAQCSWDHWIGLPVSFFFLSLALSCSSHNVRKLFKEHHLEGCQVISLTWAPTHFRHSLGEFIALPFKTLSTVGTRVWERWVLRFSIHLMETLEDVNGVRFSCKSLTSGTIKVLSKWESREWNLDSEGRHKTRTNRGESVAN